MTIMSDNWITKMALEENMIAEFLAQTDNIDILKKNIFVSEDDERVKAGAAIVTVRVNV